MILQNYRIVRRLPFGFTGDWGKVYKRYTFDTEVTTEKLDIIPYKQNNYVCTGQKVQFKIVDDMTGSTNTQASNLVFSGSVTVQTTDAYFDTTTKQYYCIAQPDDIVFLFGQYWMVSDIRIMTKYSPAKQQFFNLGLGTIML